MKNNFSFLNLIFVPIFIAAIIFFDVAVKIYNKKNFSSGRQKIMRQKFWNFSFSFKRFGKNLKILKKNLQ